MDRLVQSGTHSRTHHRVGPLLGWAGHQGLLASSRGKLMMGARES
jgi:hypothetical protein